MDREEERTESVRNEGAGAADGPSTKIMHHCPSNGSSRPLQAAASPYWNVLKVIWGATWQSGAGPQTAPKRYFDRPRTLRQKRPKWAGFLNGHRKVKGLAEEDRESAGNSSAFTLPHSLLFHKRYLVSLQCTVVCHVYEIYFLTGLRVCWG